MKWHYSHDGTQQGPVTEDEIKGMISAGSVKPSDLVWCDGMAGWEPVSSVAELMPQAPAEAVAASDAPHLMGILMQSQLPACLPM